MFKNLFDDELIIVADSLKARLRWANEELSDDTEEARYLKGTLERLIDETRHEATRRSLRD